MLHLIISPQSFVFLMLASFLAGFLDAIAGGGGLITIPAYLAAGGCKFIAGIDHVDG